MFRKGVWRWGEELGRLYIYRLHCHHQNDSCIKMGSDMRAILIFQQEVMDSHKTVPTNHNRFEEKGEPKWYRTEVLPLTNLTPYR